MKKLIVSTVVAVLLTALAIWYTYTTRGALRFGGEWLVGIFVYSLVYWKEWMKC